MVFVILLLIVIVASAVTIMVVLARENAPIGGWGRAIAQGCLSILRPWRFLGVGTGDPKNTPAVSTAPVNVDIDELFTVTGAQSQPRPPAIVPQRPPTDIPPQRTGSAADVVASSSDDVDAEVAPPQERAQPG